MAMKNNAKFEEELLFDWLLSAKYIMSEIKKCRGFMLDGTEDSCKT